METFCIKLQYVSAMRLTKDILFECRLSKLFLSLVVCCRKLEFHLILVAELLSMKDSKPAFPGKAWLFPIRALGSFHTTPKEFENAALFLRLGLPSTLIRHKNALQTLGI